MKKLILIFAALFCMVQIQALFGRKVEPSQAKAKKMTTLTDFTRNVTPFYLNDVVYRHASDMDLHLQIAIPEMAMGKKWPCIIYIQGSAWFKQEYHMRMPTFFEFSKRGYVIVSVEYRPSTTAVYPAQIQDVKSAVRFVRKNADKYGVDVNNIFVWGDSSGGNMSLLETLTQDQPSLDTEDYGKESLAVNACVAYYPVTDILSHPKFDPEGVHDSPDSPEGVLFGHIKPSSQPERVNTASPIVYVKKDKAASTAPILIMTGNCDSVLPFEESVVMADKLEECGYNYVCYKIEGVDHGSWQFWTPEALNIVDNFFKSHIHK